MSDRLVIHSGIVLTVGEDEVIGKANRAFREVEARMIVPDLAEV